MKATTLKELNDREEMDFSRFIENLKTYEMEMKVREDREPPKKKSIVFRVSPSIPEDEDSMDKNEEEDFTTLIRKVGKMFYNKGRKTNFRRSRQQEKFERKGEEIGPCYHCKKTGHLITDCPSLQAITSKKVHKKKKSW